MHNTLNPVMIGLLTGVLTLTVGCSTSQTSSATEPQSAPVPAVTQDKPYLEFTNEREVVAVVSAIDHETREVTLTGEGGETAEFIVSEEVPGPGLDRRPGILLPGGRSGDRSVGR